MADFTGAQIGGPQQTAIAVQAPTTSGVASAAVRGVGSIFDSLIESKKDKATKEADIQANQAVGTLTEEFSVLSAGIEAGTISPSRVGAEKRAVLARLRAEYPEHSKLLLSTAAAYLGSNLGSTIVKGTAKQQERDRENQLAQDNGFTTPDMSEEETTEGVLAYRKAVATEKRIKEAASLLAHNESVAASNLRKRNAGLTQQAFEARSSSAITGAASSRLALKGAQEKANKEFVEGEKVELVKSVAESAYHTLPIKITKILEGVEAGGDPEAARAEINRLKTDYAQVLSQMSGGLDLEYLAQPSLDMLSFVEANLGSEKIAGLWKGRLEQMKARNQLSLMLKEPDLAKFAAGTSLLGNNHAGLIGAANSLVVRIFRDNTAATPVNLGGVDVDDANTYLSFLRDGVSNPEVDPLEVEEQVNSVVDSVGMYGPRGKLTDQRAAIDYLSSEDFAKFLETGSLNPDQTDEASDYIIKAVEDELAPQVKAKLFDEGVSKFRGVVTGRSFEGVGLQLVGGRVRFVGGAGGVVSGGRNKRSGPAGGSPKDLALSLNKEYGAAINKTLGAYANLTQTTLKENLQVFSDLILPGGSDELQ